MIQQHARQHAKSNSIIVQLVIAFGVGVLLGSASAWFSPIWVLVLLLAILFTFISLKRPEFALLAILVLTSTVVYESQLPLLSFGAGSFHISDAILIALLGMIIFRAAFEPEFELRRTPLDLPLLGFYGTLVLSTLIAMLHSGLDFNLALRGLRPMTYYLTFFAITNLVREERQLMVLIHGLFLLGTVVAGAMLAQYLVGASLVLIPGRVETLSINYVSYEGIARILPPGQSLVLLGFIGATAALGLDDFKFGNFLKLVQLGLMGIAVILTFNRNFWAIVLLALALLFLLLRDRERLRVTIRAIAVFCIGLAVLVLILQEPQSRPANVVNASIDRFTSFLPGRLSDDESLRWREREYEYAIPQIYSHPLLGLGAGAEYRPFDRDLDWEGFNGQAYIHNGHLWIMLEGGLLGYGWLFLLSILFLLRGLTHWRSAPNNYLKGIVLGFTLTYLGTMISNLVNPIFAQWMWTPVLGLLMGTCESIYFLNREPSA
ncbi:MAG: O-antigen ligase family protein [Anaerolineales bacterium]|nr:O-antigen ligase family protein [Anaerolineales bacterium]